MARTKFTFTFSHAQPGANVSFNYPVYADGETKQQDGPSLVLDANNSVAVWAETDSLVANTVDGNGLPINATATLASPSVTVSDGTAGQNPFAVSWTAVKTANYAASSGQAVPGNASGGGFNVTLPAPAANARVTVKNVGATGTVTVLPHAAETIDGAASYPIDTQWMSRDFQSDGTNWLVV